MRILNGFARCSMLSSFKEVDYGIVGDMKEVVPALIQELNGTH